MAEQVVCVRHVMNSYSKSLPQAGHQNSGSVLRRVRHLPVHADQARWVMQKDETASGEKPSRVMKRLHEEIDERDDSPTEPVYWDPGVPATSARAGGRGKSRRPRQSKDVNVHGGKSQNFRRTGELRCGPGALLKSAPVCKPDYDEAEREAEIRAEILDGVRQLLHDESEIDCLVQLCMQLKEKNAALLERAIHRRGVAECMKLLEETLNVEANGGMLTAEGRRRTAGGVFLRLLQDRIPREDKRFIWDEQNREQRKLKRQRIRSQRAEASKVSRYQEGSCTGNGVAGVQEVTVQPTWEEREPGELDDTQVDEALDGTWT